MSIVIFLLALFNLYYLLLFFQENHYHFSCMKDLLLRIIKDKKNYLFIFLNLLLFNFNNELKEIIYIGVFLIILFYMILRLESKYVLKLKFTSRIIRNIICNTIILLSIAFVLSEIKVINLYYLVIYLQPFLVLLSFVIMELYEIILYKCYYKRAQNKLKRINPFIIAITGSAGKTSSKNYLYHYLCEQYITYMTPKSYNTIMGIIKSINEDMNENTQIAIIECGASKENDIQKIIDFLSVCGIEISLITNILPQHLETFKSYENIIIEKSKLALNSKVHIGYIHKEYKIDENKIKYYSFGFEGNESITALDVNFSKDLTSFTVKYKNKKYLLQTKLLGKNNILNILGCLCVALHLGISMRYLQTKTYSLESVKNRLELKKICLNNSNESIYIIYDCFNSNIEGYKEALNVIGLFPKKRVVITPGIVSGGKYIIEYNRYVAKKITEICDECILIRSSVSKFLKEVFDSKLMEYHVVDEFKQAYALATNVIGVKSILIENDITDIYKP